VSKTIWLLVGLSALAGAATTTSQHKATKQHSSHPAASHSAKARAGKTQQSAAAKSKTKKGKRVTRSYQQAPTPERYKEIQQALASKGYYQGEANGTWGTDSVEALKRFQAEQNLTPDGKIGSLSLIALGLGPKRLSAQSSPTPAPNIPK
jgi:peptidoglycan hydrolase-like protein with peptidoglycan-binding domain